MTSVWFYAKMALILSGAHLCLGGISSLARRSEMAAAAPLPERITAASRELKLARRDGSAEWITKAAKELDELLDKIPRAAQRQGSA